MSSLGLRIASLAVVNIRTSPAFTLFQLALSAAVILAQSASQSGPSGDPSWLDEPSNGLWTSPNWQDYDPATHGPGPGCGGGHKSDSFPHCDGADPSSGQAEITTTAPSGGPVSVQQLRHPLPAKAQRMIQKAQSLIDAGQHERAIEELSRDVQNAAAAPYAYSMLGQEYLRGGAYQIAIPPLQKAVSLLPQNAIDHGNLGFALVMTGQLAPAERELNRALELQPENPKTHLALGVLRFSEGTHDAEAEEQFKIAARQLPMAHLVLAKFYRQTARPEAAESQLQAFFSKTGAKDTPALRRWVLGESGTGVNR